MNYDHFIQLGNTLNDKIVDSHIRDGNFHYIIIPKRDNSPIRIGDRLYHITHSSKLVDDYGTTDVTIDNYIESLINDDNLKAYGVIKYIDNKVYIFGVSDYWFFEIKGNDFSYLSINVLNSSEDEKQNSSLLLYSPTDYKNITTGKSLGTALLSRYGSSDIVLSRGGMATTNLETHGYSVGFVNSTEYSLYKGKLNYKIRINIPNTIPTSGEPTIIAHFDTKDYENINIKNKLIINGTRAFNNFYEDMIDIDFIIKSPKGTNIRIEPHKIFIE